MEGDGLIKSTWEIDAEQAARNVAIALNNYPAFLIFCTGNQGGFALVNGHTPQAEAQLKIQIIETLKKNPRIKAMMVEVLHGI